MMTTKLTLAISIVLMLSGCSRDKSAQSATGLNVPGNGNSAISVETGNKAQAEAYLEKGNALYQKDDDLGAVGAYEQAVQLDPDLSEAHLKLGLGYYVTGKKPEAEKEFKAAVEAYEKQLHTNPDDPQSQFNLAEAYNKLGKHEEAARALREAVRMTPDDSDYYFELGSTYLQLAEYQEARNAFEKCLEIEPDNFRAQESLQSAKDNMQRKGMQVKAAQDAQKKKEEDAKKVKIGGGLPPGLKP